VEALVGLAVLLLIPLLTSTDTAVAVAVVAAVVAFGLLAQVWAVLVEVALVTAAQAPQALSLSLSGN
jgi:hypothetical protein